MNQSVVDATQAAPVLGDDRAMARLRLVTAALCFMTILLDGYDTSVVSFIAPTLAHDWSQPAAAFTPAFVATSLGAVIGYMCCGVLAARFGHRRLMIASVAFFGLMALVTLLAADVTQLTVCRFVTALGLGGAIPTAIALASDYAHVRRRELTAAAVTVAIIFGGTLGGVVAVPLLRQFGWQGPLILGGVVPILFAGVMARWLPDTVRFALARRPHAASTRRLRRTLGLREDDAPIATTPRAPSASPLALFAAGLAVPTVLLWAMVFLAFMQSYTFTYWLPLFLTSFGFDRASAALGNTYMGTGGIVGVLLMIACVPRLGSARYLAIAFTIGAGFILVLAFGGLPNGTIPYLLFLIGVGLGAGGVGQAAIGAKLYPAAARTTGVGMSSAIGRVGSILGPTIAGVFLALHWPERSIVATTAVPALAAAACAAGIFVMIRHRPTEAADAGQN